jgi:acetyltransferase-like isoleucine patch superfamily enzyme
LINRGVTIGHDTVIGAFSRLMPGCNVAGLVRVGYGATIGLGANVLPKLEIGARAFIAAGAVVTRDVPADHLAVGVPARIRERSPRDAYPAR